MKRITLLTVLLAFFAGHGFSQTYQNEWIDYTKTYYKFKLGPSFGVDEAGWPINKGVVRITQPALAAAGMGSIPAQEFQLWRNGKQIPVYISKASGTLTSSDYIEFWGQIEDGKPDQSLYSDSTYQLNNHWSLETDSCTYFLTANTSTSNNLRLTPVANNIDSATVQADQNFTYTIGRYYRTQINPGFGILTSQGVTLYSSLYDVGEGFSSRAVYNYNTIPWYYPNPLYVDTTGSSATARFNLVGGALNLRNVEIYLNSDSIAEYPMNYFSSLFGVVNNINPNLLASNSAAFQFQNLSSSGDDNFVVAQVELDYPRKFDFGGDSSFEFTLSASNSGRLLKIGDFSSNGVPPVLYDLTNGKRYIADLSITDTLQFFLTPSTQQYKLVLVRADGSTAISITSFQTRNFTDFSKTANQGNYLIITNPVLYGSGSTNYVQQYMQYRSSVKGGGYNTKIIDIHDLEDQFAYGISRHPLAVKNFLTYAQNKFATAPAYAFLIGKAIEYSSYRTDETDPVVAATALLPVFGSPGSDNLLASNNYKPVAAIPVGRLSVVSPEEVGAYFTKLVQYEATQQDTVQTIANKSWMKNVLHLTGVNDPSIGSQLDQYMNNYAAIISDTSFGGNVRLFSESANPAQYPQEVTSFTDIFNAGSSIVNYFGHSSSTDLDFSLSSPAQLNNVGKCPVFIVNGCLAGNIFDYDAARQTLLSTISEKFVLQPQKGAIGYLSTTSYGDIPYLDIFTTQFYNAIGKSDYGKGFGQIVRDGVSGGLNVTGPSDFYGEITAEQFAFHGDPALKINSFSKPDYAMDSSSITITPSFLSVANDSFTVKVVVNNIGRATDDSVHFSLYRKFPDGDSVVAFTKEFATLKTADSITINLPVIADRDKGTVTITAVINDDQRVSEITYNNNTASKSVLISTAELVPIYPFNFAIVNTPAVTLSASTANPLDTLKKYIMQMDTTALFNSSSLISQNVSSTGGVVQFNVTLPLNNTVYYWRVAPVGTNQHWDMFSFTHINGADSGFEQAHFFQHTQSTLNNLVLDTASRSFKFGTSLDNLFVKQAIYPYGGTEDADFSVAVNGTFVAESACVGQSIIFNIFDPITFSVLPNSTDPDGAASSCKPGETDNDFEFSMTSPSTRNQAYQFLTNYVQNGQYVVARSIDVADFAPVWAADSTEYGNANTLYTFLKSQGIAIDSYYYARSYIFVFKKNDSTHFSPVSVFSQGIYDAISLSQNVAVSDTLGYVTSPKFGPGKKWDKVYWQGADSNSNNITTLNVIGINANNQDTVLATAGKTQHTLDISSINAATYPNIMLQMRTQDSLTGLPYQLQQWSVQYTPVPEGAIAPNLGMHLPDTLNFVHAVNTQADTLMGYVTFKNVSVSNFDSLKVELVLYDSSGVGYNFPVANTKALVAGDTVNVSFLANLTALPQGVYNLYLVINPDEAQPEQYLFNNSLYKYIYINRSQSLPVQLLSFTAQPQDKAVMLDWKVTNELNLNYYGVEWSVDGRAFNYLGNVTAKGGEMSSVEDYNFLHTTPVVGANYYRLKMVDNDGAFTYSPIVKVNFGDVIIKVYPNPFVSTLNISLNTNVSGSNTVRVLDFAGNEIIQKTFVGGNITLDVSGLAAGSYLVQVNNGTDLRSFKVQKQNK